ncbi:MAG: FAD-dependent oxidoreductase [Candidatus Marinimicrobia bacterium]|nr:FAD-dependent oxidoreductase [Candidatus Neomarinimicrobiota bacterium]
MHILLNKKKVPCKEGQTILEVARENGISIPTLCHEAELDAYGSCWVCSVKVEGINGFVTSCGTKVRDGMSVITDSPEVKKARKTALELLLSDHYADCEAPCKIACPDHVDIQTYVSLIANGKFAEAVEVIKNNLPLPISVGRVCPAFCEVECRRSLVDDAVAIRQLKRCAADLEIEEEWCFIHDKKPENGKKIAVIGAGPAGLTCGYYMSTEGYKVDIFESAPMAGGWLRYGIPEYRLPKAILDREIEILCKNGMKIHYNKEMGKDVFLSDLSKNYDAVFIGIGAQLAVPMRTKGADLKGCLLGVDYLKEVALGEAPDIGKKVAVMGGGDTAIDCARTALREGADITLLYRRTRKEMPAESYEVDAAEEEGVKLKFLVNPVELMGKDGHLDNIIIEKMKLGEPDESGRRRPEATGKTYEEKFDSIIAAISQKTDVSWHEDERNKIDHELLLSKWNTAEVDEDTMHWNDNVFAGGDFRLGPATAIEAVADGKIAAISIEHFLKGEMMAVRPKFNSRKSDKIKDMDPEEFAEIPRKDRLKARELSINERELNHKEVEASFSQADAAKEAERCLECGCMVNTSCTLREYSTEYEADQDNFSGELTKHPIDETHPFILRDANKCINCGRCIRICSEVQGPAVLGYIYRGFASVVGPEFGEKLEDTVCTTCGKCIEVCPTGALLPKTKNYKVNPTYFTTRDSYCTECGVACRVSVQEEGETVLRVDAQENNDYNRLELCYKGRFEWQNIDLQYNANSLKDLKAPEDSLMLISPKMSNEMIKESLEYADKNALKAVCVEVSADPGDARKEIATMKDLENAETIILIGTLNQMLKAKARSAQLKGTRMIVVDDPDDRFNRYADVYYAGIDQLKIKNNEAKVVFIYNRESVDPDVKETLWKLIDDLPNAKVWVNSDHLNTRGLLKYDIPLAKEIKADNVIIFGPTPHNVEAKKIYRLPLKAFYIKGTVISDCREEIIL